MTAEELQKWRKSQGCSQSELARVLAVTTQTVSRWERETREIPSFLHLALRCLELEGGELQRIRAAKGMKKPFQYPVPEEKIYISEHKMDSVTGKAPKKKKGRKVKK